MKTSRIYPLTCCLSVTLIASVVCTAADDPVGSVVTSPQPAMNVEALLAPHRQTATDKWEKEMVKFDKLNSTEAAPKDAVLFVGSSSIRRWENLVGDMQPYAAVQRGYGGAKFSDVAVYAERLLHPHKYRAVVFFVGNDVAGKPTDKTPDEVEALVRYIVGVSHKHQSDAPVFLIEVTPTSSRFDVWPKIRQVNARLREISLSTPNTYFIPTASNYLSPTGEPLDELFVGDKLHLNEDGYRLWTELIRRRLDDVL